MAEYIDREKVLALGYWHGEHPDFDNPNPDGVDAVDVSDIEAIPAADVAEVVFARWEEADWREYDAQSCETIRYQKAAIVCTNCRCAFKKDALWKRNFCPSCGRRWMELENG